MRAKHILGSVAASALALGLAFAAAPRGYLVVLKDGSWVKAAEKPVVEDGQAQIRLPGGLLAVLPDADIDWPRSDRRSRELEILFAAERKTEPTHLPSRATGVSGTLTVGDPSQAAQGASSEGASDASPGATDPNQALRARLAAINLEINNLQGEKAGLTDQMSREWNLDAKERLRRQVDNLDQRIQELRREQSRLLLQRIGQ